MKEYLAQLVHTAPSPTQGRNVARQYLQARKYWEPYNALRSDDSAGLSWRHSFAVSTRSPAVF